MSVAIVHSKIKTKVTRAQGKEKWNQMIWLSQSGPLPTSLLLIVFLFSFSPFFCTALTGDGSKCFNGWCLAWRKQSKTLKGGWWLLHLPFVRCWSEPAAVWEIGQGAVQKPQSPALICQPALLCQEGAAGDAYGHLAF